MTITCETVQASISCYFDVFHKLCIPLTQTICHDMCDTCYMTEVNWEIYPGETIQKVVAALILLEHPNGNFITPSRGDRGVDIRVPAGNSFIVYQVKRYTRPLSSREWSNIKNSWDVFAEKTIPYLPVSDWKLVMPWDPTNEAFDKLQTITGNTKINVSWIGRTQLNNLAANNPKVIEYYLGNGANRITDLMNKVFLAGSPPENNGNLLDNIRQRAILLQDSLDEVDPFYRYEIEVRNGKVTDNPNKVTDDNRPGLVMSTMREFSKTQYLITRIFARCAESTSLRPIRFSVHLKATTEREKAALSDFVNYGAPFKELPATFDNTEGPEGALGESEGQLTALVVPLQQESLPPFEIRAVEQKTRRTLHATPVKEVERTTAPDSKGAYVHFIDSSGCFDFRFKLLVNNKKTRMDFSLHNVVGKDPDKLIRTLTVFSSLSQGTKFEFGIQDGITLFTLESAELAELATHSALILPFFEALKTVQGHTLTRISVPDPKQLKPGQQSAIMTAAKLLHGERINTTWTHLDFTVSDFKSLSDSSQEEFAVCTEFPLTVSLGNIVIQTNCNRRIFYKAAKFEQPIKPHSLKQSNRVRLIPGSTAEAVIQAVPLNQTQA